MPTDLGYFASSRPEVAALLPNLGDNAAILEVGCGEGNFARHFTGDRTYWGIEPSIAAAEAAAKRLDKVLVGSFRSVCDQIPDHRFDCVICNDVIEHMDDHDWFLQTIKSKMRSSAVLVGSVPNVRHISNLVRLIFLKDWEYADQGILDRTHQRFFTERSLKRALTRSGYVIQAFSGINESTPAQARLGRDMSVEVGKRILSRVFGSDSRFPQFAFRVGLKESPPTRPSP